MLRREMERRPLPAMDGLESIFARGDDAPLVSGDRVGQRLVEAYWYDHGQHGPKGHCRDRVVLRNGASRDWEPFETTTATRREGIAAALRLPSAQVRFAAPGEIARFDELLRERLTPHPQLERLLRERAPSTGWELWLAGGPVRDVLRGAPLSAVKDLDCAGTLPAGRFYDIARQELATASPDYKVTISKTPVVHIQDHQDTMLLEYKPLELWLAGVTHAVSDNDLVVDAGTRDLTVNALFYEPRHHVLFDPTGNGFGDVETLTLRPLDGRPPLGEFLRILKFVERFAREPKRDFCPAASWISSHFDEIRTGIEQIGEDVVGMRKELTKFGPAADARLQRLTEAAALLATPEASALAKLIVDRHG